MAPSVRMPLTLEATFLSSSQTSSVSVVQGASIRLLSWDDSWPTQRNVPAIFMTVSSSSWIPPP